MNLESLLTEIIAVNQNTDRLRSVPEAYGHIQYAHFQLLSACADMFPLFSLMTETDRRVNVRASAVQLAAEAIRLIAFLDSQASAESPRDTIPAPASCALEDK